MGTPAFATASLDALYKSGYNIVGVVTTPDKPVGRGLQISQSDVKRYAVEHQLKVIQPQSLKDPCFEEELRQLNAHLYVVVAFRMLPQSIWSIPQLGTFNLHASLLPQYRGAAPINWALINGETKTGVTTFLIDQNIDTGAILFQRECPIDAHDNAGDLHDKLMEMGSNLVVETVQALINGTAMAEDQHHSLHAVENLKSAPKLTKETGKINWSSRAVQISNLVRGLSPYPCAHSVLVSGGREIPVKIFSAKADAPIAGALIGEIYTDGKSFLKVSCKEGSLAIESIQAAGKKRLNIKEFLAGIRDITSFRFQ